MSSSQTHRSIMRIAGALLLALTPLLAACEDDDGLEPQRFSLTVSVDGPGIVQSNPPGISCGPDCAELYTEGRTVTLIPAPDDPEDTLFVWGGDCADEEGDCTLVMGAPRNATIDFDAEP